MLPAAPLRPNRNRRAGGSMLREHDPPLGERLLRLPDWQCLRSYTKDARVKRLLSLRRPDRTHFDAANAAAGNACRDRDGFVEVLCINQIVAAQLFASLRKRT